MTIKEAAEFYISLGWYPIPLVMGTKECRDKKWKDIIYVPEDFTETNNIGLRLVKSTDEAREIKLVSVDLDCPEAVSLGPKILPPSAASWGRATKAVSQILYIAPFPRGETFKDLNRGKMLLELRVDHQSMVPPSTHDNGELLHWNQPIESLSPLEINPAELLTAIRQLGVACLMARYYPDPGARHEWMLAFAGTLKSLGEKEDSLTKIVRLVGELAQDPSIEKDRVREVSSTFARSDNDPTAGSKKLAELTGGDPGKRLIESLRKLYGAGESSSRGSGKNSPNNQDNIRLALDTMKVRLSYDEFSHKIMAATGEENVLRPYDDKIADSVWLQMEKQHGFRPTRDYFDTVIRVTAQDHKYHPVKQYLDGLSWDGTPRIMDWLVSYGGAADSEFCRVVGKIFLVAAVRRVRIPGVKFDELLILESIQGKGKSSALRALCPSDSLFSDDLPLGASAKEVIERTSGKWLIEAQELAGMRKSQVDMLKSFLSRQSDGPVRLAYARLPDEVPRQFAIVGSTNNHEYLKDATGNRRFWPIRIDRFDVDALLRDRDQLWAEASEMEKQGFSIRLPERLYDTAAMQQERRRETDPWEGAISDLVDVALVEDTKQRIDPEDIWMKLGILLKDRDTKQAERIASVMQKLGFKKMTVRRGKTTVKGWGRDLDGLTVKQRGLTDTEKDMEKLKRIRQSPMNNLASEAISDESE